MQLSKGTKKAITPWENDKVFYLTFDDGPNPVYTDRLLDLLAEYNIKATFFVVAKSALENSQIIQRMKNEGHLIGLHSYEHKSAMLQTLFYTNMDFRESLGIMKALGVEAEYYRPPWGHVNLWTLSNIKKHGLKKVLWDVMADDWEKDITDEEIQYNLLKRAESGDVICLHDGRGKSPKAPAKMLDALERTIPIWIEEGYTFKRIDEKDDI